ncbi:hypothetical protein [Gillisia marina]|uniref:hypothetical protein n=1 Tax=Gillisia marina TaxID=1167637 RepID=UPI00029B461C|nr:hypothetical protein [Gillisia marina]
MAIKISINPFVDFELSSEAKKLRIIKDQKNPSPLRVGWYQTPRASIKKSLKQNGDSQPLLDGIDRLKNKITSKPQQLQNKMVSIEALDHFISIKLPTILKNHQYEVIKEKEIKSVIIDNVEIVVSPDVIFKIVLNGETYIGAIKLHLSKNNVFDLKQSLTVSTLIHQYCISLSNKYELKVLPDLCFSVDVFGERIVSAPINAKPYLLRIKNICKEVKKYWSTAA